MRGSYTDYVYTHAPKCQLVNQCEQRFDANTNPVITTEFKCTVNITSSRCVNKQTMCALAVYLGGL
jgi:hypothetical protein